MTAISTSQSKRIFDRNLFRATIVGLLCIVVASTGAFAQVNLLDIRIGKHADFDRIVCELSGSAPVAIQQTGPSQTEIVFTSVALSSSFRKTSLPKTLAVISSMDVIPSESSVKIFLKTRVSVNYEKTVLPEPRWRLILDFMPSAIPPADAAQPTAEPKRDYVPGDRPIETRYSEVMPTDSIKPTSPDSTRIMNFNRAHSWAVLAYYYNLIDDTHSAGLFRDLYEIETGKQLSFVEQNPSEEIAHRGATGLPEQKKGDLPPMWIVISVFFIGTALGYGASRLPLMRVIAKSEKTRKVQALPAESDAGILQKDLKKLDSAVRKEKTGSSMPYENAVASEVVAAEAALEQGGEDGGAATISSEEDEIKENLVDRRVRRVLELNKSGHDIAFIAKELEMGQDEVKLILDLNQ